MFGELLSAAGRAKVRANVPAPPADAVDEYRRRRRQTPGQDAADGERGAEAPADPRVERWEAQQGLLLRLRHLGDDALAYTQETGVDALYVGYPILSLPPGVASRGKRRILAPVALVGCSITVRAAGRAGVELRSGARDVERVVPNSALFAWLSRELGVQAPDDLFADEAGDEPWRELRELTQLVATWLDLDVDVDAWTDPERLRLRPLPRAAGLPAGRALLPSAVLGLFPASNQSLVRDTEALLERGEHRGPIRSFLTAGASLDGDGGAVGAGDLAADRDLAGDRLVLPADPMQARAVRLARRHRGLVVHGPPGTGKSQTIANMVGDHLSRGERVLFVCDKRTALDVVYNRLRALGLGDLCALVHDPRRDRRDLFMQIRGRLDELPDLAPDRDAADRLAANGAEIRGAHGRLDAARAALSDPGPDGESFHGLTGRWLDLEGQIEAPLAGSLDGVSSSDLDGHRDVLRRIFRRGLDMDYPRQPWAEAAGARLDAVAALSVEEIEGRLRRIVEAAERLDEEARAAPDGAAVEPFDDAPLGEQVARREDLADRLDDLAFTEILDRRHVADLEGDAFARWKRRLAEADDDRRLYAAAPPQRDLEYLVADQPPTPATLARQALALETFLETHRAWWGFLRFRERADGRGTLRAYGLAATPEAATRLLAFLRQLERRHRLSELLAELRSPERGPVLSFDVAPGLDTLEKILETRGAGEAAGLGAMTRHALFDGVAAGVFIHGLRAARRRAAHIEAFEDAAAAAALLAPAFAGQLRRRARRGQPVTGIVGALHRH
ncbi:MAG: AAA domain-containing protein, partial [Acidobacteriota bacterium]